MTHDLQFTIPRLLPYINWIYFNHTWRVSPADAVHLRAEADHILQQWATRGHHANFRVALLPANSDGEDIIIPSTPDNHWSGSIPLLRQQHPPFLCLSDFFPPVGTEPHTIGIYASTVPFAVDGLLEQTLADRLSEAAAELGHQHTRRRLWGYAPDEDLTPQELFAEHYQGIRPAIGYPSLPDQSLIFTLADILDFNSLGITLTQSGAMLPHASTTGLMISHPQARHFSIGTIGPDQLADYARRRNLPPSTLQPFIPTP